VLDGNDVSLHATKGSRQYAAAEARLQLLDEHPKVVAYFNWHNHAGNYAQRRGVHYLNLEGMGETAYCPAFSIIQVHADRRERKGFGREKDRVLRW
jgi:manganese-dependent ADP-ribose/CDP-alcohol diphosphatase